MSIMDLIQFPHQGRKTGKLSVTNQGRTVAVLFYENGNLVCGRSEHAEGIDAIVELVDLQEGDFVFDGSETPEEVNIEMELHHAILTAVKLHDERKRAEDGDMPGEDDSLARYSEILEMTMDRSPWIRYACILRADGCVEAEARGIAMGENDDLSLSARRDSLSAFVATYPGGQMRKVLVDHEQGVLMAHQLPEGRLLLVDCESNAVMGAVVARVSKAAQAIGDLRAA